MSIGDVNSNEKGSGARYNDGKPDFSLIPMCTLEDEARVWAYGKKKYAAWNWCKGMSWDVPFSCLMRHMAAWQRGEENDAESGLPHLAHAMCNLRMLTLFSRTYKEGDNRPVKWFEDWLQSKDPIPEVLDPTKHDLNGGITAAKIEANPIFVGKTVTGPADAYLPGQATPVWVSRPVAHPAPGTLGAEIHEWQARQAGLLPKSNEPNKTK